MRMWLLTCQQGLRVVARNDKTMQELGRKDGKQGVQPGVGAEGAREARKAQGAQDIFLSPYAEILSLRASADEQKKKAQTGLYLLELRRVGRV